MAFVIAWDDYVLALQLITSDDKKTLPIGIVSSLVGQLGVKWADMMAASVLMSLPVVIFFVFVQSVIGLFRSRASLEAEILTLRHQLNLLRRKPPKRRSG
jgi:ABC-type glycerol-3-phosphate transport system permease component